MNDLQTTIEQSAFMLAEAAISERLRRTPGVEIHPRLEHSLLLYSEPGRQAMRQLYRDYLQVAGRAGVPILLQTPTWRANFKRMQESDANPAINRDASRFMRELIDDCETRPDSVWLAGLLGCKNDCYRPEEALSAPEAAHFHRWQIDQLIDSGVDCLFAATLPSVEEALGIANAMQTTELPFFISFVIGRDGCVLDGTPLDEAVNYIDQNSTARPAGYFVNCSYPTFINAGQQPPDLFRRLVGIQANASSLEHCELDGSTELQSETVADWGRAMLELHHRFGIKILGGCCGTDTRHLEYLVDHRQP